MWDGIPECLHELFERCLSTQPGNRFNEFASMQRALLEIYQAEFDEEYQFPETEVDDSAEWWSDRGMSFYWGLGRYASSEKPFKEALKRCQAIPGRKIDQANCLGNLGSVYQDTGKFQEAEVNLRDALDIFRAIPGTEIEQARCLANLGNLYSTTQEFSKAQEVLEEALKICGQYPIGTEQIRNACLELLKKLQEV
ncbi:MAG: Tetratricopeptide repeat protein [Candidatus Scalindua rubra]|uniref:Tetratricopeptide repeat protein n=1 Tax=Candidatus Scalindua rubra TaxID=1872076 RepID=A0A1E3X6F8_9BACT|nr:MAG: Tetratricopeptide repeat protein [Candidatus Scalindua rubra]